jgi:hypothetical protein
MLTLLTQESHRQVHWVRFAKMPWQVVEKLCHVIPGRAEGANPESRKAGNPDVSGFRARRHSASKTRVNALMAASRNDVREFFSSLLDLSCAIIRFTFQTAGE